MKRVLLSNVNLMLSSTASRRNLMDMEVATVLGDFDQQNTLTEQLKKNNGSGNDPDASLTITGIKSFIAIYATSPLLVTLTNNAQTTSFTIGRFFVTTAAITQLVLKNESTLLDVPIKIVYS